MTTPATAIARSGTREAMATPVRPPSGVRRVSGLEKSLSLILRFLDPRPGSRCICTGFVGEEHSMGAVRRHRQLLEPVAVDRRPLRAGKLEEQRNRCRKPNAASPVSHHRVVFPGEKETFVAAQLGGDHHLEMRQGPVVELDLSTRIPVQQFTQGRAPFTRVVDPRSVTRADDRRRQ